MAEISKGGWSPLGEWVPGGDRTAVTLRVLEDRQLLGVEIEEKARQVQDSAERSRQLEVAQSLATLPLVEV